MVNQAIRLTLRGRRPANRLGEPGLSRGRTRLARVRRRKGLRLHVRKRLPVAAGLAAGAATRLRPSRRWRPCWTPGVPDRDGPARAGSRQRRAVLLLQAHRTVEGRGERVTPLQLEAERWLLLVKPRRCDPDRLGLRASGSGSGRTDRQNAGRLPRRTVDHGVEGPQL